MSWKHELAHEFGGHVLHSGCNILPERLICRQNEVPLIYTFELCSPERVPLFAGSLKGPTSCMDLPLRNRRDHFNCFPLINLYQMEILLWQNLPLFPIFPYCIGKYKNHQKLISI